MSSERDKMMGVDTYLFFLTSDRPYRKVELWDRRNARSELVQLHTTIAQQAAQIESLSMQAALLDDYAETVRMHEITIEAQAAQLSAARVIIQTAKDDYLDLLQDQQPFNELERAGNCDAWLSANPAQKA